MTDTNFQPIFDYIDQSHKELEERLRLDMATKTDSSSILNAIDSFAKASKDNREEIKIIGAKTDRVEKWVMVAAEKIEVPYKP